MQADIGQDLQPWHQSSGLLCSHQLNYQTFSRIATYLI
jgi:hypothetical protein